MSRQFARAVASGSAAPVIEAAKESGAAEDGDLAALWRQIALQQREILDLRAANETLRRAHDAAPQGSCSGDTAEIIALLAAQGGGEQGCCAAFASYSQSIDARIDAAVSENDVLRAQLDELKERSGYPETWYQRLNPLRALCAAH